MTFDDDSTLACVGKFDPQGVPIVTSRHLSQEAMVTFQAISLHRLLGEMIEGIPQEPLETIYIRHENGSTVRVDRNFDGFIAYII
jgi:hypothetical protein